jgi:hypothetical protein
LLRRKAKLCLRLIFYSIPLELAQAQTPPPASIA